jgi:hypothetical protein
VSQRIRRAGSIRGVRILRWYRFGVSRTSAVHFGALLTWSKRLGTHVADRRPGRQGNMHYPAVALCVEITAGVAGHVPSVSGDADAEKGSVAIASGQRGPTVGSPPASDVGGLGCLGVQRRKTRNFCAQNTMTSPPRATISTRRWRTASSGRAPPCQRRSMPTPRRARHTRRWSPWSGSCRHSDASLAARQGRLEDLWMANGPVDNRPRPLTICYGNGARYPCLNPVLGA